MSNLQTVPQINIIKLNIKFSGTHVELIKDPEGAYSQLIRLQEGASATENTRAFETDKANKSLERRKSMARSGSLKLSFKRSLSIGSSSSRHSLTLSFGLPGPVNIPEIEGKYDEESSVRKDAHTESRSKVSIKRLAYLNKPELPVLLFGSVAAIVNGVIFPIFGLLLSSTIEMFFKPHSELKKDSRFWSLLFLGMGFVGLLASPLQNFLFGIAGGKLIQRIRSLTFEKVVHQEISWFDDTENSRYDSRTKWFLQVLYIGFTKLKILTLSCSGAIGARLSSDASTIKGLVGDALALLAQNLTTIVAALVIAFVSNWILAFIVLAVSPILVLQGFIETKFLEGFSADAKVILHTS